MCSAAAERDECFASDVPFGRDVCLRYVSGTHHITLWRIGKHYCVPQQQTFLFETNSPGSSRYAAEPELVFLSVVSFSEEALDGVDEVAEHDADAQEEAHESVFARDSDLCFQRKGLHTVGGFRHHANGVFAF